MGHIFIDIEENDNCGYHPMQTFETVGDERVYAAVQIPDVYARTGPHVVVGWHSEDGGGPCPVTVVEVTDSGASTSLLIAGGDCGIRLRPAQAHAEAPAWKLGDPNQWGEPYLLLPPETALAPLDDGQ